MAVCAACGTENRDKAKFCKGCAQALVPLAAPAPAVASSTQGRACPACHAPNRRSATVCNACGAALGAGPSGAASGDGVAQSRGRWGWVFGPVVLLVIGSAWWWQARSPAAAPAPPAPQQMAQPALAPSLLVRVATATVALPAPAPPVAVTQPPSEAPPPPAAVKKEPKTAKAPTVRNPSAAERPVAPATPPRAEPEPALADATPRPAGAGEPDRAPAPAASVDQLCAGSSNFITRDICRVRACSDGARAGDPVCVRFRQMEEDNRQRQRN